MDKGKRISEIENIGFISTRIAGTDGVSLEIGKWADWQNAFTPTPILEEN
jgi:hypothetical protein